MHVVTILGSLGPMSSNAVALDRAAQCLGASGSVTVEPAPELSVIPAFRPDLVDTPPEPVARLRKALEGADGVLIAAPEYAAGMSGVLKNALDWMVGSGSLYHRPTAALSAGSTGGSFAIEHMVRTLSWQGALVVATLGISAPASKMDNDVYTDPDTLAAIDQWALSLRDAISEPSQSRMTRVAKVVTRYDIDPSRFGI